MIVALTTAAGPYILQSTSYVGCPCCIMSVHMIGMEVPLISPGMCCVIAYMRQALASFACLNHKWQIMLLCKQLVLQITLTLSQN